LLFSSDTLQDSLQLLIRPPGCHHQSLDRYLHRAHHSRQTDCQEVEVSINRQRPM
jgi:hypothetical protein